MLTSAVSVDVVSLNAARKPSTMKIRKMLRGREQKKFSKMLLGGAGVGELSIGQKVLYKQTPRSDPEEVVVVDVELPGHNGSMRTKTYYHIQVKQPGRVCSSCFL